MNDDITIVSACDEAYAFGVWLLIASIRKCGMNEKILIGAYNWSQQWKDDIRKFPNVEIADLPITDKRCVTCSKPDIMLKADTDYVIWIDCDGFLTGNCSDAIKCAKDSMLVRPRAASEVEELYRKIRRPFEAEGDVPEWILDIWKKDVADLQVPRYDSIIAAAIIGVYLPNARDFLQRWRQQMYKVLPDDVSIVDDNSIAYFQTDESVFNSMLLFDSKAPKLMEPYLLDHLDRPHFKHFAFNPKPWIMWNKFSLPHFDAVMDIVEWAQAQGYAPKAPLPYTYIRKNKPICTLMAKFSGFVSKYRKYKRKFLAYLKKKKEAK